MAEAIHTGVTLLIKSMKKTMVPAFLPKFLMTFVIPVAPDPRVRTSFLNMICPTHTPEGMDASKYPISIGTMVIKIFEVIKFTLSVDICYNALGKS
jgi:hypothetical protein